MTTLTQSYLNSLANQTFNVTTDYTMNGATLIFNGITLNFNGGTISNGTMYLNNCTLTGTMSHSIDANVEGTMTNSTINSSWFTRIGRMRFDFSNKTIDFDENATILNEDDTVKIDHANHAVFDGHNKVFTCYANFFEIYDDCNYIEIRNFKATAVGASVYQEDSLPVISFLKMGTRLNYQTLQRTYLNIHHNVINKFNVGISLGADEGTRIEYSNIYYNHIIETVGTEHGYGYGIHLANAYNCQVYSNYIEKTTRHAIYHAWGTNNSIYSNIIKWHWKGVIEGVVNPGCQPSAAIGNVRAAIAIYRHSEYIEVKNNSFFDSYNASIHIHSFPDSSFNGTSYGIIDNITIENNFFQNTIIHDSSDGYHEHKYPAIFIGFPLQYCDYDYYSDIDNNNCYIDKVDIINNRLVCLNSDYTNFCRLYQCKHPNIENNEITFSACSIISGTLVCRLINLDTANLSYSVGMTANIKNNVFRNTNNQLPVNVEMSVFSNVSDLFSSNYIVTIQNNTLYNQVLNGIQMYQLYYNYVASTDTSSHPNFNLQLES